MLCKVTNEIQKRFVNYLRMLQTTVRRRTQTGFVYLFRLPAAKAAEVAKQRQKREMPKKNRSRVH